MSVIVIGGDGFIGGHLVEALRFEGEEVESYDIKSGNDARNTGQLIEHLGGVSRIYHLAAHADILMSATHPMLDFDEGTWITASVLEAARIAGVKRVLYASSSAVYGDVEGKSTDENYGPLIPISTYAASKIACEAMMAAYSHIFGMTCVAFRFANVVGLNQPRGVAFDFMKKLREDPHHLEILGDGTQTKSYVHVDDVIDGILRADDFAAVGAYDVYNIATEDTLTAHEIALLACGVIGITDCEFSYTGGRNGWRGDVPIVNIDSRKLRSIGWRNRLSSRAAIIDSLEAMK